MKLPVWRLRTWLVLSHLVVFLLPVLALVGTGALARDLRQQTEEDLRHQAALMAMLVEGEVARGTRFQDLGPTLRHAKETTLAGFRVVGPDGRVAVSSGGDVGEFVGDDVEIAAALSGRTGTVVRPRDARGSSSTPLSGPSRRASVRIYLAVPLERDGEVIGALALSRTPREELQAFWQMLPRLSVGVVLALAGTVGLALGFGRVVSRSLESLASASHRIARSAEEAPPEIERASRSQVAEARALAAALGTMRARLRDRLAYIAEFAGNVSHEFKTPVSSLRGTVELLRDDEDMAPEQRARFLDNALLDLDRLARLVGGLLRLARAEEGGERGRVELAEVLAAVRARHPALEVAGAGEVVANREQLEAAVTNLVENAFRHGGEGVRVRAEAWSDDAWAGVDVVDDGPGISPANLPRVFDRFFTTDRQGGGTGLGLALVRAVSRAQGGDVTVESAPGRTAFRVRLPR
ncbi:MAG: sensor histidine kinase [Myxococcota bacterium]